MSAEQPEIKAWRCFVRAKAEVSRAAHRELCEKGVSGGQVGILRVLTESGSAGMQLNEISQRLYVTNGNVTGLIDRLEEAGYIARVPHPKDRRITLAVLTDAGKAFFEATYPPYMARIKQLMGALTVEEQGVLAEMLTRVADRAAEMAAAGE